MRKTCAARQQKRNGAGRTKAGVSDATHVDNVDDNVGSNELSSTVWSTENDGLKASMPPKERMSPWRLRRVSSHCHCQGVVPGILFEKGSTRALMLTGRSKGQQQVCFIYKKKKKRKR